MTNECKKKINFRRDKRSGVVMVAGLGGIQKERDITDLPVEERKIFPYENKYVVEIIGKPNDEINAAAFHFIGKLDAYELDRINLPKGCNLIVEFDPLEKMQEALDKRKKR